MTSSRAGVGGDDVAVRWPISDGAVRDAVRRGLRANLEPEAFAGRGFWAEEEPREVPAGKVIKGEVVCE